MIKKLKPLLIPCFLLTFSSIGYAQMAQLSLQQCYQLARDNYPLNSKRDLIKQSSNLSVANTSKLQLPQISLNGQASYQSETVGFPAGLNALPGVVLPTIDKDQYKIQAEVSQQIYDAGIILQQKAGIRANQALQEQNLEVNLYSLKERVNQYYFSVLLIDEQLKQQEFKKADLQAIAASTAAAIKNGVAYKSNLDQIKAEIIIADMYSMEALANRWAYLQMLGLLIAKPLSKSTQLSIPEASNVQTDITRPELKWYTLQKKVYDVEEQKLKTELLPKFNAFLLAAYGRPTLNFFENKFGPWYITGIKMNWNIASLYTLKNNRQLLAVNRQNTDLDKQTFLLNTQISLAQQNIQISKYQELIEADKKVIDLRAAVKTAAKAQLDNGVITIHDYISHVNAENLARQTLILHQIQLLQTQYQVKFLTGL
jgi:outer membrane protein